MGVRSPFEALWSLEFPAVPPHARMPAPTTYGPCSRPTPTALPVRPTSVNCYSRLQPRDQGLGGLRIRSIASVLLPQLPCVLARCPIPAAAHPRMLASCSKPCLRRTNFSKAGLAVQRTPFRAACLASRGHQANVVERRESPIKGVMYTA